MVQIKNRLAPAPICIFGTHELFAFALFSFQRTRSKNKSVAGLLFGPPCGKHERSHAEHSITPVRDGQEQSSPQADMAVCPALKRDSHHPRSERPCSGRTQFGSFSAERSSARFLPSFARPLLAYSIRRSSLDPNHPVVAERS